MKKKEDFFQTNPQKASAKVTINSFMMGSLFFILTLIWSLNPEKFSLSIITQLVLAIPLLFISSLAYSKIGYWKEVKLWDYLGWFTNNLGNIFILNVIGLMTSKLYLSLAWIYFSLIVMLMVIYSWINCVYSPYALREKAFKLIFFLVVLLLGGILPLLV
ncbi:MAG TPA: hypothetical protein VJG90_01045 [Candidatus Nanoarchaeia archaeon]|nr:hypothetical protein [Candidatus Nanoarchaeia archaeon]